MAHANRHGYRLAAMAAAVWLGVMMPMLSPAQSLSGRVVSVMDGDTLHFQDASAARHPIRLAHVDAPEHGQPFAMQSRERLAELVLEHEVTIEVHRHDRFARIVGTVVRDGYDINLEMVRAGMAWWFRRFASKQSRRDRALYRDAEEQARAQRLGLWRDAAPIAPWEFRALSVQDGNAAAQTPR